MAAHEYHEAFWVAVAAAAPVIALGHTVVTGQVLPAVARAYPTPATIFRLSGLYATLITVLTITVTVISAVGCLTNLVAALSSLRLERDASPPALQEYRLQLAMGALIAQGFLLWMSRVSDRWVRESKEAYARERQMPQEERRPRPR